MKLAGSKRQHSLWQGCSSTAAALEVVVIVGAIRNVQAGGDAVRHVHRAQRVTHRHSVEQLRTPLTMPGQRQPCVLGGQTFEGTGSNVAQLLHDHAARVRQRQQARKRVLQDGMTHQQSKLIRCALWQRVCLPVVGACKGEQTMT